MIKKTLIAAAILASTPALADGQFPGYRHQHNYHNYNVYRGGNDAGALFGGLIGGMIIGGMMAQPQQRYYYQNYPICRQVFSGSYFNGYQWIDTFQQVCN